MKKLLFTAMMIATVGLFGISCTKEDYSDDIVGNWDIISKEHFLYNHLVSFSEDIGETWIFTEDGFFRRIASDGVHSTTYTISDNELKVKNDDDHFENYGRVKVSDDVLIITLDVSSRNIKEKYVTTLKRKPSGHHS